MKSTKSRLIVVLGMHRSGTSAITRALVALGVDLGNSLLPPDRDINDAGYWEDVDLNQLNMEMLDALQTDWHHLAPLPQDFVARLIEQGFLLRAVDLLRAKVSASSVFGFKDPRVSLLLAFWKKVFPHCNVKVSYLLAIRNPISVIKSLAKRDQFDLEKSALLWLTHTVSSLEGMRGERSRALIDYDRLMRAPEPELYRLASDLKLQVDPNELQIYQKQFLDEKLRHTTYGPDDLALNSFTESFVQDLYSVLLDAASGKLAINAPAVLHQLARSRGELDRWEYPLRYVDSLYHFKRSASQEITSRDAQIRESQAELVRIRSEIASERQTMLERDSAISTLEKLGAERASQVQELNSRLARTEGELVREQQAVAHCNSTISRLEIVGAERASQVQELNSRLIPTEGEWVHERQAVAHCNSTISALEKVGAERVSQIQELNSRLERTEGEFARERQAVAHCGSASSALHDTLAKVRQQVEEFQARFERTQGESILEAHATARRESAMNAIEVALTDSRSQSKVLQSQLVQSEGELREERIASAHRNARIQALEETVADKGSLIESMNRDWAHRRLQIETLLRTVGAYEQQISSLTAEGESARLNIATLQKTIDAHDSQITMLRAEGDSAQSKIATLQEVVEAYEHRVGSLTAEGNAGRSEITILQNTADAYKKAIILLTAEGDAAQRSIATLQQTVGGYKQQAGSLTAERDAAQRSIATLHQTLGGYKQQAGSLTAERDAAQRSIATSRKAIAGQSEMVRLVETARADLQAQLRKSESKVDDLEGTVSTLQEHVRKSLQFTRVNASSGKAGKRSALRSLLDYDGHAFVRAAYLALLRRESDTNGQLYYWGRLRAGAPKLQLLAEISRSAEARRANCSIPGLKAAVRLQQLARTPIAGDVIASLLKLESFGPSQTGLRALQQQGIDTSLALDMHFEHFEQSLQLLRQVTLPREKLEEVFIPRWDSSLPQSVVTAGANDLRVRREQASHQPLVFQIEYAATASPASVGLSDDTRELAAGFRRIRITDELSRAEVVDIDFAEGGNARDCSLFGFSDSEEWGSWTNGKKSAFVVWQPPEDLGTLEVSIDANPFHGAFSEMPCVLTSSMGHRTEFVLRDGRHDFRVHEVVDAKTEEMFYGGKFGAECPNNVSLSSRTPKFSIIILNFNKPQLSLLSARSVLAASISHPFEVIIVDNGSTSENLAVLETSDIPVRVHRIPCNRFFGEGNNLGAEVARGEYLVFLNNDAFVAPRTIDALADAFDADPKCGIAGPIFRYPDGRLQEAGAFIGVDGVAEQRGKFGAPFDVASLPHFDVVDYVSAACLMIRASRFFDVGGFNYRFDPAYYEDTDLCFRIRLRNEHVLLARDAVCFHIENATTADKRSASGVVSTADHNRKVFLSVWGDFLADRSSERFPLGLLPPSVRAHRVPKWDGTFGPFTQSTYSPYPLVPGGGERVILGMTTALNQFGPAALITPDPFSSIRMDNVMFDLGLPIGGVGTMPLSAVATQKLERVIVMGNEIYPSVHIAAKRSFFHCQFPFPLTHEGTARLEGGLNTLAKYEKVIVNSEFTRCAYEAELSRHGRSARVDVLNPPVATDRFLALERNQKPWIVSIGRFSAAGHSKRQDVLIDAMKATSSEFKKGWKLVLCGNVPNNSVDRAYFRQLNESVGNDIDVEFVLSPSTRLLDSYLAQSSIYAHACGFGVRDPDDYWKCEHFGITLVEALAAGCQIICYEVGGGPEIIARVGSGATFGSVEELAWRLEDIAGQTVDPAVRHRTSELFGDEAFSSRMIALVR
jgi:O-antigen biosynthesis protein